MQKPVKLFCVTPCYITLAPWLVLSFFFLDVLYCYLFPVFIPPLSPMCDQLQPRIPIPIRYYTAPPQSVTPCRHCRNKPFYTLVRELIAFGAISDIAFLCLYPSELPRASPVHDIRKKEKKEQRNLPCPLLFFCFFVSRVLCYCC